jgi:hypothetical protein
MAQINFDIQNFGEAEVQLQTILDIHFEMNASETELYTHYVKIMTFYLYTNIERALLLGKALSSQQEFEKIPFNIQNDLLFVHGVE